MELQVVNNKSTAKVSFTHDQKVAVDGIIDFIAAPFDASRNVIGLTGAGGTGKTFVTKYIIENCKWGFKQIACTSPTHKACRVFSQAIGYREVNTIQSTFGFRLDLKLEDFDPNHPQFNPKAKIKLEAGETKVLIIDESSMLNAGLVSYIIKTCAELKIKIIFIGDSYQLSPVNEHKSTAFSRCNKVYVLNEIVRQKEDNPIMDLLITLRDDISLGSYNFLSKISKEQNSIHYNSIGEGYCICNPNTFRDEINRCFRDEAFVKDVDMYRVVAYTNLCVSGWNTYIRNTIIKDANTNIITKNDLIMSYETIVDKFLDVIINNSEEYIIKDISEYVDDTYGFKGFMVRFQLVHGGMITSPLFIINHKDAFTIKYYHKVITDLITAARNAKGGTRVKHWTEYYNFKKKYLLAANVVNKMGKIIYSRDIDYGFAITAHKSQGSTYTNVFVDVNNMVYDKNGHPYTDRDDMLRRLYVACSRARTKLWLCYGR